MIKEHLSGHGAYYAKEESSNIILAEDPEKKVDVVVEYPPKPKCNMKNVGIKQQR